MVLLVLCCTPNPRESAFVQQKERLKTNISFIWDEARGMSYCKWRTDIFYPCTEVLMVSTLNTQQDGPIYNINYFTNAADISYQG